MTDVKHAGVHWPENAGGEHPNVETILAMPGISRGCTLICSPSARYWYRQARGASPLVVWRAIPRQNRLPAMLGWDPSGLADECLTHWDEQPHGGTEWFLPLNELQAQHESGGPWLGYARTADHLGRLRAELRRRLPADVRLMFPAWAPSDDGTRLGEWRGEAARWDAVALHCYGSAATQRARYLSYRAAFPGVPIFVSEWNAGHEGHDERAILRMWAEIADADPGFLGAAYYIWETRNAGEADLSVWGDAARLALFRDPPTVQPKGAGMFGLVVSPGYVPDAAEIEALHPAFLRSIIYRVADIERLALLGPPLLATVNNECAEVRGDWSGWDDAMRMIADSPTPPFAVCVGNEFDLYWQHNHADVPPAFAADLVRRAAAILRPAGIKVVATSVAGGDWQNYLAQMADLCRDDADYFDLHPYGQKPDYWRPGPWMHGDLRVAMARAYELARKPVICSEYGVKIGDAGGESAVADFLSAAARTVKELGPDICPYVAWFAWRDEIGAPSERGQQAFGLRAEDGRRRPAWDAFAALQQEVPVEDVRFVLGFKEWHDEDPDLIGDPVENEQGGVPGMSQQLTTRGLLTWCNLVEGQAMTFYCFDDQIRYVRGAA